MRKPYVAAFVIMCLFVITPSPLPAYEKEIKSLSSAIVENIGKASKKTVAIVDFTDLQGNVTELGRFIAEELSVDLTTMARDFEVVDRTHLRSILAEHKLSLSGLTDPKTVKKLGEIAGVDAIITGSVTPFGDSIRVSVKVIATNTAKVVGATKGDIAKTKAIEDLLARGIEAEVRVLVPEAVVTAPSSAKAQQRVEVKDFLFELQGCKASGQTVSCSLLITNKGKDRDIWITVGRNNMSRIVDDSGNEYRSNKLQIGTEERSDWMVQNLLVSGIPTKATISFDNVSPQAKMIRLLELDCGAADGGRFKAQLRNIRHPE